MALSKELQKIYDDAVMAKGEIMEDLKPMREQEAALRKKIKPINDELEEVLSKIADIERSRGLGDISKTIAALAPRATKMKVEGGTMGVAGNDIK